MHVIQIADPAIYGDTEWISVLFHGQSFMLHQVRIEFLLNIASIDSVFLPKKNQIVSSRSCARNKGILIHMLFALQRKMMSALILACRTGTPPKVMNEVCVYLINLTLSHVFTLNTRLALRISGCICAKDACFRSAVGGTYLRFLQRQSRCHQRKPHTQRFGLQTAHRVRQLSKDYR